MGFCVIARNAEKMVDRDIAIDEYRPTSATGLGSTGSDQQGPTEAGLRLGEYRSCLKRSQSLIGGVGPTEDFLQSENVVMADTSELPISRKQTDAGWKPRGGEAARGLRPVRRLKYKATWRGHGMQVELKSTMATAVVRATWCTTAGNRGASRHLRLLGARGHQEPAWILDADSARRDQRALLEDANKDAREFLACEDPRCGIRLGACLSITASSYGGGGANRGEGASEGQEHEVRADLAMDGERGRAGDDGERKP
ncbi:hypothetical protein FB451DRAFT_1472640 [Mycena latifolia]|nr:hypothetical protein FB451DRAFT_1472640 [Mycena latifolia]